MFIILWQLWIGEIGKKDYQNAKKTTNSKWWNLWRILDFKCLYFLEKIFHNFTKFYDKISNPQYKEHKNF